MNIINSNLEYLLNVAEKIIIQCADITTKNKYFIIKEQVLSTSILKNKNFYTETINYQPTKHFSNALKESTIVNRESLTKTISRKSIQNFKENKKDTIQRGRIKTYSSKNSQKSQKTKNQNGQMDQQYFALSSLSNLIKNAEACPDLLKTMTIFPNSFNDKINQIMNTISSSLSTIYTLLKQSRQTTKQLKEQDDIDSLRIDNKWLIHKLELMLQENQILRRVVGVNTH